MSEHHAHHHSSAGISEKNLLAAVVLNFAIAAAEIVGGILSNSLALLSDALHNLGDGFAVLLAYIAHRVSKRESNNRKTFGYKRVEILAAFINAIILVAICIFLIFEAIERFQNPAPIKGAIMFSVATVGLVANLVAVILLKADSKKNINIRAAYLHLMGDTLSSIVVIIGGLLIWKFGIYWIDPLITLLISLYILKETFLLLRDSFNILMQSAPKDIDLEKVKSEVEKVEGVKNIHHVHLWSLNDRQVHFEGHVDLVQDMSVSQASTLNKQISRLLHDRFDIEHTTLQMEFGCCEENHLINEA
ncbi:MAG TPA: cation transporter [Bacteroides sp.]|nr:cation transporter [Bacteroides sp.]